MVASFVGLAIALGGPAVQAAEPEWRAFSNKRYRYEIRLPAGFSAFPTGPEDARDGRTVRIARDRYAAPAPVLDIDLRADPSRPDWAKVRSPDTDVSVEPVAIGGVTGRVVTLRWKETGHVSFVEVRLGRAVLLFHAGPGTVDARATVWWKIIESFRFRGRRASGKEGEAP